MYHYLTKNEYFTAIDDPEIYGALKNTENFGLKHCQDACVLKKLASLPPGKVAEAGGGVSRTLPSLAAKGWQCWNIEPFEGAGNGPRKCRQEGINNVGVYLGRFSPELQSNAFDAVYSISVIEHVPDSDMNAFFEDMFRILKPGGRAWHAIDVYLRDETDPAVEIRNRRVFYAALKTGFVPVEEEEFPDAAFHCAFATNPDLVMRQWNRSVPALAPKRAVSQSVSLLLGLKKPVMEI